MNAYYMKNCPACGQDHHFEAKDGVPFYELTQGATFRVSCPDTSSVVEVVLAPDNPPAPLKMADTVCTTCGKANYKVVAEQKKGGVAVLQKLECTNPGCATEFSRVINSRTGKTVA